MELINLFVENLTKDQIFKITNIYKKLISLNEDRLNILYYFIQMLPDFFKFAYSFFTLLFEQDNFDLTEIIDNGNWLLNSNEYTQCKIKKVYTLSLLFKE